MSGFDQPEDNNNLDENVAAVEDQDDGISVTNWDENTTTFDPMDFKDDLLRRI